MFSLKILLIAVILHNSESVTFKNVKIIIKTNVFTENDEQPSGYQYITLKSSNDLSDIERPSDIFLNTILIENQRIPKLEKNSIKNIKWMEYLQLPSNQIQQVEKGAFQDLENLVTLDLSGNLLEELTDGIFNDLPVWILKLHNNKINKIGDGTFSGMTNLGHLELNNNKIKILNSNWFENSPKLGFLDLRDNLIEEVPAKAFQHLKKYGSTIYLGYNKIRSIHSEAFSGLKTLDWFNVNYNSLEAIPEDLFKNIEKIKRLSFTNNSIYNIDENLLDNTKLKLHFELEDNFLACIPTKLSKSMDFNHLKIDRNPFTCDCVENLKKWNKENDNKIDLWYYNKIKCTNI